MKKYIYRHLYFHTALSGGPPWGWTDVGSETLLVGSNVEILNALGQNGWQCVSLVGNDMYLMKEIEES